MAIRRVEKKKFKGVTVKSGYIYRFKYQAWENDPQPVVIMMYALDGIHPRSGHQWRFFQAINFTYVPRAMRKQFVQAWIREYSRTKNLRFTWEKVKRQYPYVQHAVRRYFFKPTYYITDLEEIPFDEWEKTVVSTWAKDFSKKVKSSLINKFRRVLGNRKKFKRTGRFPRRK
jgi:hypothetical protein